MATTSAEILAAIQTELASLSNPTTDPYLLSQNIASMLVDYATTQSNATYQQGIVSLAQQAPKCKPPVGLSSSCAGEHQQWLIKVQAALQNAPNVFAGFDLASWLAVGGLGVAGWLAFKAYKKRRK